MKKLFEVPEAEILKLSVGDVVCASGMDEITDGGDGIAPTNPFDPGTDD